LLNSIWIIDKDSGTCVFLKRYGYDIPDDQTLISRFFSALWNFFREIEGRGISTLTTTELDFSLAESEKLLFIVATARDSVHQLKMVSWVKNLKEEFFKSFEEDYNFQNSKFVDDLNEKLDQVVEGWIDEFIDESEVFSAADLRIVSQLGTELNQLLTMRFGYQGLEIIKSLDGLKTVKDIQEESGLPNKELKALFRISIQHGLIEQSQRATDLRIPYRTTSTSEVFAYGTPLRNKVWNRFGNRGIDVIGTIDGIRHVREISAFLGFDVDIVKQILELAQKEGLIEW
jgi:DNA-binding MarR family transcriptional regulator